MSTALIEWFIGSLGATVVVVITAVVVLLRVAFKLGGISHEVSSAAKRLEKIEESMDLVPIHETKIKTLEGEVTILRRKAFGLPSHPDMGEVEGEG
mgnify:CR=1 FL=1